MILGQAQGLIGFFSIGRGLPLSPGKEGGQLLRKTIRTCRELWKAGLTWSQAWPSEWSWGRVWRLEVSRSRVYERSLRSAGKATHTDWPTPSLGAQGQARGRVFPLGLFTLHIAVTNGINSESIHGFNTLYTHRSRVKKMFRGKTDTTHLLPLG